MKFLVNGIEMIATTPEQAAAFAAMPGAVPIVPPATDAPLKIKDEKNLTKEERRAIRARARARRPSTFESCTNDSARGTLRSPRTTRARGGGAQQATDITASGQERTSTKDNQQGGSGVFTKPTKHGSATPPQGGTAPDKRGKGHSGPLTWLRRGRGRLWTA